VVDSASIEVNRRPKRAKTDRLDMRKLAAMLIRYDERKVWSVVQVPSVEEEDNRHLHRELKELRKERTRLTNRIPGVAGHRKAGGGGCGRWRRSARGAVVPAASGRGAPTSEADGGRRGSPRLGSPARWAGSSGVPRLLPCPSR